MSAKADRAVRWPPSWRTLKALSKTPLFAGSSALLIVSSLSAALLEHVRPYLPHAALSLPFKVALVGTLLCMISGIVFAVRCPDEIKHSKSHDAFVAQQMPVLQRAKVDDQIFAILPHITDLPEPTRERIRTLLTKSADGSADAQDSTELDKFRTSYFPAAAQRYLFKEVERADVTQPNVRLAIIFLFAIGGTLDGGVLVYRLAQALWY